MKKLNFKWISLLVIILTTVFTACSDNDSEQSRVTVRLTDAPGDYDEVNVEVIDVLIKSSTNPDDQGWVSLGDVTPTVYNLLDLTGGVTALLAENNVPSGKLGQIRLVLGTNNTVVKDGMSYDLKTPSGQQSGLKLLVNTTLQPDFTYDFLIDFDVEKSIVVQAGSSGNYNLNPVLRVSAQVNSGAIKGTVAPANVQTLVSIPVGETTISAYTNEQGVFQLNGVPSGTYTITLTPDPASELAVKTIENVIVANGQITDLGNITLE
jgi:hypothetical protein